MTDAITVPVDIWFTVRYTMPQDRIGVVHLITVNHTYPTLLPPGAEVFDITDVTAFIDNEPPPVPHD